MSENLLRLLRSLIHGYRYRHPIDTATSQDLARLIRQARHVADEAEQALIACECTGWRPDKAADMAVAANRMRDLGAALSKGTRVVSDRHKAMDALAEQIRNASPEDFGGAR